MPNQTKFVTVRLSRKKSISNGFTLFEILIALFIFSFVSMMIAKGLRTVIDAQSATEVNAERLRKLERVLLVISRDVEQTVNRPVLDNLGGEESAFVGASQGFSLTHGGYASLNGSRHSTLERVGYYWHDNQLWRTTWPELDQAPKSRSHSRMLLGNLTQARFQYLDKDGHYNDKWPTEDLANQPLPRAVKMSLRIGKWGEISQVILIQARKGAEGGAQS